ncbi:hypothetical protein V7S43_014366 [Phytophthora oleae]|uniref:Uncharacterized protein n=1 Tax=Phytophthora oleae TaxID=2107226 RepID=A0ABD3F4K4_9STRA
MIWTALVGRSFANERKRAMPEVPGARKRIHLPEPLPKTKRRSVTQAAAIVESTNVHNALGSIVEFRRACIKLRQEGWASKPPRPGLDIRYRYIKPGRDVNGEEGVGFLLGEEAVLQFIASNANETIEEAGAKASAPVGPSSGTCARFWCSRASTNALCVSVGFVKAVTTLHKRFVAKGEAVVEAGATDVVQCGSWVTYLEA